MLSPRGQSDFEVLASFNIARLTSLVILCRLYDFSQPTRWTLLERNRDRQADGQTETVQRWMPSCEGHKKWTVSRLFITCRYGNCVRNGTFVVTLNWHVDLVLGAWLKWRHSMASTSSVTDITCLPGGTSSCGFVADHCPVDNLCLTNGPRYCHACLPDVTSGYCRRTFRIYT